ncbi:GerAB/ArcD/ProY family transporter [Paenibacillus roseipurpureus]|uniref:GerAB/ArcD/ProY family transporter n=1 Tax=Paenibacillus roseopurpureus TaxID=2918901 RepID=A0AA96LQW0_9BACL|nr:GerAB/ArcD/ProY family transporter [Paenibacillus sp. MBLB1832]WNR44364.1 GerAB/ArcD/ProY family transporter [Paenibacillus sp. MBLB1832]
MSLQENNSNNQLDNSSLFFLTAILELSTGAIHLPKLFAESVQNESWIVLTASACLIQLFIFLGLSTVRRMSCKNWYELVEYYLGRIGGIIFALLFCVCSLLISGITLRDYTYTLQQFVFPRTSTLVLASLVLLPVIMLLSGGISLISRFVILVFMITVTILIPLFLPLPAIKPEQFLPIRVLSGNTYLQALFHAMQSYIGIVVLFFVYPYASPRSGLYLKITYGHWFACFILITLNFTIVGITGYEFAQHIFYPSLHAARVSQFAFTQRFEFIIVTLWSLVIIVMISSFLWLIQLALPMMNLKKKQSFAWLLVVLTLCIVMVLPSEYIKFQTWYEHIIAGGTVFILLAILLFWLLSRFKKTEEMDRS